MAEQQLLVFLAPAERRDDLVDVLMEIEGISGFTLIPALGYSREHHHFSLREQVSGYREFARFEVLLEPEQLSAVLTSLEPACGNERLRYWVGSIESTGHLPRAPTSEC
jgi:hypothetical protein